MVDRRPEDTAKIKAAKATMTQAYGNSRCCVPFMGSVFLHVPLQRRPVGYAASGLPDRW
jgi:hypothetical protein